MYTLKVVVAGFMLAAPHHHTNTTFSIPFETHFTCQEQLESLPSVMPSIVAIARRMRPMKPTTFKAACVATGTSGI